MATKYAIETIFRLIDQATGPMNSIGKSGNAMSSQLKKSMIAAEQRVNSLGRAFKTMGTIAVGAAVGGIVVGLTKATQAYIEFDNAVKQSGALFKDLDSTSSTFEASLDAIGAKAREVAAVTEFNAVDTAGALQKMAMAGMSSQTAMDLLAGTTDLATAAGTDLTTAVDIATDALGAFNLEATAGNLQRISDVMALTASTSNTGLIDMFEAIKYAGPGFTAAGQSAETLSAAIGTLANAGIKGSMAGTALQAVFTQLSKADKVAALADMGVAVSDAEGNFRNLYDIISDLEGALAGLGEVERSGIINQIFDTRGGKAMNLLLASGSEALKAYETDLYNASGAAATMAGIMRTSMANQVEVLKSGLTELGFKFVEAFKNEGSDALAKIIEWVQNFDPTPLINFLKGALDGFVNLVTVLWNLRGLIEFLVIAWTSYRVIMDIIVIATKAWSAAQAILNAVMNANPIGLIITGVSLLVAGIVALIANWDTVCEAMSKAWEWMKNIASIVWEGLVAGFQAAVEWIGNVAEKFGVFLGPIGLVISAIKAVGDNWEYVKQAFTAGGFLNGIKAIGLSLLSGILAPIQGLLELLSHIPGLGHLAQIGADKIASIRAGLQSSVEESAAPANSRDETIVTRTESVSNANLNVSLEPGLRGSMSGNAPGITVNTASSGTFSRAM